MAFKIRAAIQNKDIEALEAALDEENDINLNVLVNGCTPLGLAAYVDFDQGANILLQHESDPDVRSYIMDLYHWKGTETPLHTTCRRKNTNLAAVLLSYPFMVCIRQWSKVYG